MTAQRRPSAPAATARGVSRDEFEERMDGDAIRAASDALFEEIMGFSHPALRDAMAKAKDAPPATPEPASATPSANAPAS